MTFSVKTIDAYKREYLPFVDKIDIDPTMFSRVTDLDHVKELYTRQTVNEIYNPCLSLFLKVIVHWNGDVFARDIPYDFNEAYYLGNMSEEGFALKAGCNSPKANTLRQAMTYDTRHRKYDLCRRCFSSTSMWEPGGGIASEFAKTVA